eukprot:870129-Pyramimonas_sp.AAC.1
MSAGKAHVSEQVVVSSQVAVSEQVTVSGQVDVPCGVPGEARVAHPDGQQLAPPIQQPPVGVADGSDLRGLPADPSKHHGEIPAMDYLGNKLMDMYKAEHRIKGVRNKACIHNPTRLM